MHNPYKVMLSTNLEEHSKNANENCFIRQNSNSIVNLVNNNCRAYPGNNILNNQNNYDYNFGMANIQYINYVSKY
jgi:hypothetical protein